MHLQGSRALAGTRGGAFKERFHPTRRRAGGRRPLCLRGILSMLLAPGGKGLILYANERGELRPAHPTLGKLIEKRRAPLPRRPDSAQGVGLQNLVLECRRRHSPYAMTFMHLAASVT